VKSEAEARAAHDALLAIAPEGAVHEPCGLCPDPLEITKEVAQVAGTEDRTYTEAEHLALMADAVKRETAELTDAKGSAEAKVSELTSRVDVLEAEKAALETAKAEAQKALDDYKAEVERAREVETAKQERLDKVKAANEQLPDSYFTEERIQRWAEMAEEAFTAFIEDITAAAGSSPVKETAAFSGGQTPTAVTETSKVSVGSILRARRDNK
jgi:chromosome segregation ATPase